MSETYNNPCEEVLAHHGILGMKWGVRRYQNKDGSLTDAGRRRYGVGEEKQNAFLKKESSKKKIEKLRNKYSKYRSKYDPNNKAQNKYYQKYLKQGASPEEAKAMAYHKYAMKKALAIAGAVTVTSVAVMALYKHHKYISDVIIKADTPIKRITKNPSDDLTHQVFAAFDKKDVKKYVGLYGNQLREIEGHTGDIYQSTYKVKDSALKIAGHKTGRAAMNELMKDPEYRQKANALSYELIFQNALFGNPKVSKAAKTAFYETLNDKPLSKKGYEALNTLLAAKDERVYSINEALAKNLKAKGYAGILDVYDQKYTKYYAKTPAIFFDHSKIEKIADRKISDLEIKKTYVKEMRKVMAKDQVHAQATLPGNYLAGTAALTAAFSKDRIYTKKINEYRKAHPNTDKDYYELLYLAKKHKL